MVLYKKDCQSLLSHTSQVVMATDIILITVKEKQESASNGMKTKKLKGQNKQKSAACTKGVD